MPLKGENRDGDKKNKKGLPCQKLSLPGSIMGMLNTAKHFKVHLEQGGRGGVRWSDENVWM